MVRVSIVFALLALACVTDYPAKIAWLEDHPLLPFEQAKSICTARHLQTMGRSIWEQDLAVDRYRSCIVGFGYRWMPRDEFRAKCDGGELPQYIECARSESDKSAPQNP